MRKLYWIVALFVPVLAAALVYLTPDQPTWRVLAAPAGRTAGFERVVGFTADGSALFTVFDAADSNNPQKSEFVLHRWDRATGERLSEVDLNFPSLGKGIFHYYNSPCGKYLTVASYGNLWLLETATGQIRFHCLIPGGDNGEHDFAFSSDGRWLAFLDVRDENGRLRKENWVWDAVRVISTADPSNNRRFHIAEGRPNSVRFSPDAGTLALYVNPDVFIGLDRDCDLLLDLATGKPRVRLEGTARAPFFLADGRLVSFCRLSDDRIGVRCYDVSGPKTVPLDGVLSVADPWFAETHRGGVHKVWEDRPVEGIRQRINDVARTDLFRSQSQLRLRHLDLSSQTWGEEIVLPGGEVCVTRDGACAACMDGDHLTLWDLRSRRPNRALPSAFAAILSLSGVLIVAAMARRLRSVGPPAQAEQRQRP